MQKIKKFIQKLNPALDVVVLAFILVSLTLVLICYYPHLVLFLAWDSPILIPFIILYALLGVIAVLEFTRILQRRLVKKSEAQVEGAL